MKKNASQAIPSPNKCALCGDYFCMLRSTFNKCGFCHRVSLIHHSSFIWKVSTTKIWFIKHIKILCSKCSIDSQYSIDTDSSSSSLSRRNSLTGSLLSSPKVFMWQCRLCSEQREVTTNRASLSLKRKQNKVFF